ncbi:MAG: SH3 domain-containing protein [Saprospiraceae bacterium]|jgi:hypothetical protein
MQTLRICLILTLAISLPLLAYSIGAYKAGDKLNVHAASGLVLRETASPTGKKITTLSYGIQVTVLADALRKTPFSVEVIKGYSIKGFWVKVRTARGQEGFVFDGYLSRYKIPASLPNGDDPNDPEGMMSIQERYLIAHAAHKGPKVELEKYETTYHHFKQLYANGDEVEVNAGEGGSEYIIRFNKSVTMEEAYLIGKEMWFGMTEMKFSTALRQGNLVMNSEDGMYEVEVAVKNGIAHLFMRRAD